MIKMKKISKKKTVKFREDSVAKDIFIPQWLL